MSAITGIFRRDGRSLNQSEIKKMNDTLNHRGPDGYGIWHGDLVSLAHQMLYTTTESLCEKLPFEDNNSGLVITADARIDNRKELSENLSIDDKEDIPDSFFILKAYEKWGEKCPERLLGDFAFAIWDKDKERLFCARDHMGVKPFYYYLSDKAIFFATEMKALFVNLEVPSKLNDLKIAFHLMNVKTDKKLTFYKDIFTLGAACSLTVSKSSQKITKYWQLDPKSRVIMDSDQDYFQAFNDIFTEAVNCRLRSVFPLGFELSGGLDTSSVVCMARDIQSKDPNSKQDIKTFSMVFNGFPNVDESYYIKKVTDLSGITSHLVSSDSISPLNKINKDFWNQEQPFHTPNMSLLYNLQKKMKDEGVRVLLIGTGGDQTVNLGRNYLKDLFISFKWQKLITELNGYSSNTNVSIRNLFFEQVIVPLIPIKLIKFIKKLLVFVKHDHYQQESCILNQDFLDKLGFGKNVHDLLRPKKAREYHYFVVNNISNQSILEIRDKIASNFSIETRCPFYDKRLVEFCYSIPDEMKFKFGWNRYTQRMAMENILPKEVQWRPLKVFFNPVLERNLLLFERDFLEKIFSNPNPKIARYIDWDVIKKFYHEYKNRESNFGISSIIWLVTLLEIWLNQNEL